jgi:FKBP-type peptidyl-prolyl cis-trans isomerase SlpA
MQSLSREEFPQGISLEPGVIVEFTTPGGDEIPGTIVKVGDESVEVDFNHPFAGRDLVFEVEILEVS